MPNFEHLSQPSVEQPKKEISAFPDFELPDLSPLDPKKHTLLREVTVESAMKVGETVFPCRLLFDRRPDPIDAAPGGLNQRLHVNLELFDSESTERVAAIKSVLIFGKDDYRAIVNDRKNHDFWLIHTRIVNNNRRHSGIGSAALRALEHTMERVADAYPELKAEWIEIRTYLSSLTKMIISQSWLEEHQLEYYKKRSGPDFGYVPHDADASSVERILEAGSEELKDTFEKHLPEICLYKKTT